MKPRTKAKKFFKNNLKKLLTNEKQDDKLNKQSGNDGRKVKNWSLKIKQIDIGKTS
ncbi:MAG: hypothetical protein ACRCW0_01795 [Clostridium sp.]